jgi:transmembrane 9 superfamily member 2/4
MPLLLQSSLLLLSRRRHRWSVVAMPWLLLYGVVAVVLMSTTTTTNMVVQGFYVPGVQPHAFLEHEEVPLKVNALTSTHTQIPRDYYRLKFCRPKDGPKMSSENLGEFLSGNKIQNSPYQLHMLEAVYCKIVCRVNKLDKLDASKFRLHIKYGYHNNWIIDNMPSAAIGHDVASGAEKKRYAGGFPIGFVDGKDGKTPYLYNHVNIHVDYYEMAAATKDATQKGYRVVGFAVEPLSVAHKLVDAKYVWKEDNDEVQEDGKNQQQPPLSTCQSSDNSANAQHLTRADIAASQKAVTDESIIYTYSVVWHASTIEWSSRWDVYLSEDHLVPAQVHWYSITNSILVVLFLSLLVVSILVRNLRRDIAAYNALATLADEERDDEVDETGWKLVHADVFRPPQNHMMLYCVFLGSGAQLALTVLIAIGFAAIGFLSPARRGSLINAFLALYVLSGIVAGYTSSRLYKAFRGRQWQYCTVVTALLFPGIAFGTFCFFNIILFFLHSSASAPFLDIIIVAALWCCVSVPLVFVGAYFGYKQEALEFPTETSTIARAIPPPPALLDPKIGMALTGIIPFAAAYVELFFIMTSLWMDQFYYVFGFTLIVYLILIVTCAEATVLLVYYQLCAENHRWWWFAFFSSGSTAFYTFLYSIFWFRTLEASKMVMTYLLYFGYMFLISFAMLLLFGTVGALTSLWFIRKIFATIKVD